MDDRKKIRSGGAAASQQQQQSQSNGINNSKKKRKNKRRRNPQRKGSGASSSSHRGPPLTPTVKVTVRNIRDADVAQTIRTLIFKANEKIQSTATSSNALDPLLVLDEVALEKTLNDEKMAAAATTKWQKELESKGKNETKEVDVVETSATKSEDEIKTVSTDSVDTLVVELEKSMSITERTNGSKSHVNKEQIVDVRVVYMIPPRKTRRRGDKPGIAYLLLTAPPIEAKTISITELHPITEEDHNVDTVDDNDPQPLPSAATIPTNKTVAVNGTPAIIDYSRDIARRRLLLDHSIELLQNAAKAMTTSTHSLDTAMVVETSMHERIWKQQAYTPHSPVDRMAGSIFQTDDYQQFMVTNQRTEEERKARPKPPPGGGVLATSSTTAVLLPHHVAGSATNSATTGNGAPVAALVLHLQKKQEEENLRKLAKRNERDSKKVAASSKKSTVKPKAILMTGTSKNKSSTNRASAAGADAPNNTATKSQKRKSRRVRKPKDINKPTESMASVGDKKQTSSSNSKNRSGG